MGASLTYRRCPEAAHDGRLMMAFTRRSASVELRRSASKSEERAGQSLLTPFSLMLQRRSESSNAMQPYRKMSGRCVSALATCLVLAACGGERPIDSGYQHRTVSGQEFGFQKHAAKINPKTVVETVRLQVTTLERKQRRYYRKYKSRRNRYGSWSTRKTVKGERSSAPNVRLALASVSKGLSAGFVGGNASTDSDGLVSVRTELKHPFMIFVSAPLNEIVRHPDIAKPVMPRSGRKREWFQLTATVKSAKKRAYKSFQRTYDIRPTLKKVARVVHADRTVAIRIVPANIDSRFPFGRARITLAPLRSVVVDPRKWLKAHVRDDRHLSYATEHFPGFVRKESVKTSGQNGVVFRVAPGPYKITISHPKYYFLEKTIGLGRTQKEVKILMSELGTKHRVKIIN